ncbi:surface-adhesin E family protein [Chryseobacterium sp. NKUCC03_KSP]|uniref:surface-adhesin E family protein n=1 Tax=Chryseobacterium sp. NKUCC03_KSP TaxID=2842125 RepID=UPI001C5AF7AF|nr:surface-adhesin E family protein [Chryseobacterium sp. NKUCC03_KSP]MBW3524334.1 hypothetical protein [Chryseobacterium sp. NKUCC03_KSP]
MKKLLFILLIFPVISFAQENWEYVGKDSDNGEYFIKDAKKNYSNNVVFWTKELQADKIVKTKKGAITKKGGSRIQQLSVDCTKKTIEITSNTEYNSSGKVIVSSRGSFIPEPAVPDSVGEMVLLAGCRAAN